MSKKVIDLNLDNNYKIFAISDIHGHFSIFTELLEKLDIHDDDYLIILGDFINKGIDSLRTLKKIRELNTRKNTIILKGNHELKIEEMFFDKEKFFSIESFLKNERYETLFHSILKNDGLSISDFNTMDDLYTYFIDNYKDDFDFISHLPIMAESNDYIFVHGGYDEKFDINDDESKFLKYDNYNEIGKPNRKNVVVGHWPTCNLRSDKISNQPYINESKKIISIDGGIGVKNTGELTAFIIENKNDNIEYDFIQHNSFESEEIIGSHVFKKEKTIYVNYPYYEIELVTKGERMSECIHIQSGAYFTSFNSLLIEKDNDVQLCTTYSNNFLNLNIGDMVEVVKKFEDCALVKHKEEFGWILLEQIQ